MGNASSIDESGGELHCWYLGLGIVWIDLVVRVMLFGDEVEWIGKNRMLLRGVNILYIYLVGGCFLPLTLSLSS